MINAQSMSQIKIPPIEVEVFYQSWHTRFPQTWLVEHDRDDYAFLLKEGKHLKELPPIAAAPMLNDFMKLGSVGDVLEFLKRTGFSYYSGRIDSPCEALYGEIKLIQRLLRDAAVMSLEKWPSLSARYGETYARYLLYTPKFEMEWNARPPFAWCKTSNGLEAFGVVLRLQKLQGIRFRYCLRSDCGQIYEVTTKHPRKYCSFSCAHLVAVRNSRERREMGERSQVTTRKRQRSAHKSDKGAMRRKHK